MRKGKDLRKRQHAFHFNTYKRKEKVRREKNRLEGKIDGNMRMRDVNGTMGGWNIWRGGHGCECNTSSQFTLGFSANLNAFPSI